MAYANLSPVRAGLSIALLVLLFNIGLGVSFGVFEDGYKNWIKEGIAAHPQVHDTKSESKIWRYVQRAHFHAGGIGAFSLAMILLVSMTRLKPGLKKASALLISLGGVYPLSWFTMFLLAPAMGRDAAHHAMLTELLVYIGVASLITGMAILIVNLLFGLGEPADIDSPPASH